MTPSLPPLLTGVPLPAGADPLAAAAAAAQGGAEPGTLHYAPDPDTLAVAVTLTPAMPLARAMSALFAVTLGLADAIGALAPPEVAVHLAWPARLRVNGAACGQLRAAAATEAPDAVPDWLVIAARVPIRADTGEDPGRTPECTTLHGEGCAGITAERLLESFSRHMLVWINTLQAEGPAPLIAAWRARCDGLGREIRDPHAGIFRDLDAAGGMLLERECGTATLPLTDHLAKIATPAGAVS